MIKQPVNKYISRNKSKAPSQYFKSKQIHEIDLQITILQCLGPVITSSSYTVLMYLFSKTVHRDTVYFPPCEFI